MKNIYINKKVFLVISRLFFISLFLFNQIQTAQAESPLPISLAQWQEVRTLTSISSDADDKHTKLYVFFDPNCPVCAEIFGVKRSQTPQERAVAVKALESRHKPIESIFAAMPAASWIPVNHMKANSLGMDAGLLRSANFTSIIDNFKSFDFEQRLGAIPAVTPLLQEKSQIARNTQVWKTLGGGTPLFVFQDKQGKYMRFIGVAPIAQMNQIFEQVENNKLKFYSLSSN
jgi:hypothetical protein